MAEAAKADIEETVTLCSKVRPSRAIRRTLARAQAAGSPPPRSSPPLSVACCARALVQEGEKFVVPKRVAQMSELVVRGRAAPRAPPRPPAARRAAWPMRCGPTPFAAGAVSPPARRPPCRRT
jgi:hypothetical protein